MLADRANLYGIAMLGNIRAHLIAILREWVVLLLGALGGGAGLLIDVTGIQDIPWWIWAGFFVAVLIVAQYRAFAKKHIELLSYTQNALPSDRICLHDVYDYLKNGAVYGQSHDDMDCVGEIRQQASNGIIVIWGKRIDSRATVFIDPPYEKISPDYWNTHTFTEVIYHGEDEGKKREMTRFDGYQIGQDTIYCDLQMSEKMMRTTWRKKRKKYRLRLIEEIADGTR